MSTITYFQFTPYNLALRRPWISARGTVTRREGFVVMIETDEGIAGYGDCAPLPGAGTETMADAETLLGRLGNTVVGETPDMVLADLDDHRATHPAACCGVETACLDALAIEDDVALHRYLAPDAQDMVQVNATIGPVDAGFAERAEKAAEAGYSVVKAKVGLGDPADEVKLLRDHALRLPYGLALRLDANEAWEAPDARLFLEGLAGLPIDAVEEPCRDASLSVLAELQDAVGFPIALDESLARRKLDPILDTRPVRRLVLKPTLLGGPARTLKIGRAAIAAGLEVAVTTTLESAVGTWAATHVAAALDAEEGSALYMAHGLATAHWLARDVGRPPMPEEGQILIQDEPGLGISPF